jgi:hypothetical protein
LNIWCDSDDKEQDLLDFEYLVVEEEFNNYFANSDIAGIRSKMVKVL